MSYNEQAEKINKNLRDALEKLKVLDHPETKDQILKIFDNFIWFGQVAKYRCRSNTAYDNFSKLVFQDIVELERSTKEGMEFESLHVKELK